MLANRVVGSTLKGLTRLLCRIDDAEFAKVPKRGPMILVANHINFIEVPLMFTHLQPRLVTGFAKAETWDNPAMRVLFNMWGAIPLRRGEADTVGLRRGLQALEAGYLLAVAPEGTRSGDGQLKRGHPGVVYLALRSRAPILPIVYYGSERLRDNLSHLRRTDFHIVVGRPFYLEAGEARVTHEIRQQMVDEIMFQLATLLPPAYRGYYADLSRATEQYLHFPDGSNSNLQPVKE
jgi:1-acyl-sn-glycerol-3-phosphate acyltransferase